MCSVLCGQIARTTSDDGLANGSLISHASGLSTCMLAESHPRSVRSSALPCHRLAASLLLGSAECCLSAVLLVKCFLQC